MAAVQQNISYQREWLAGDIVRSKALCLKSATSRFASTPFADAIRRTAARLLAFPEPAKV